MGMFSPYEYDWISPGKGALQVLAFIVTFAAVCYTVKLTYPDRVSYPREFEGGLDKELGGAGGVSIPVLICLADKC
jgi:NADH dehydrogenase (ubiquinone) 1 beta subcomplex subunit 8